MTGLTLTYDVAANYKVLAENYNECYHCGPVHPELSRLVPAFAGGGTELGLGGWHPPPRGGVDLHDEWYDDACPTPRPRRGRAHPPQGGACLSEPAAVLLGRSRRGVCAVAARRWTAPGSSAICCSPSREVESESFDPGDAAELWDLVNRQDWAICESVQRGMTSRAYRHGWFAEMEDDSADIRRWLLPRLQPDSPDGGA